MGLGLASIALVLLLVLSNFSEDFSPWSSKATDKNNIISETSDSNEKQEIAKPATPQPTPAPPQFVDAVWLGVGDIMSHSPQLPGSYNATEKKYNFDPFFEEVKPILKQGDWVMANLETPIAGKEYGYTGYPSFNAPLELAEALKNAGFNLFSTANNHSLDKGEKGLLRTLEHLKGLELQAVGTASSQEEADALIISEKNGIKMGLLSYTYGTNGIPIPEGKPYLVNLIDEEKIKKDITRLKEGGADLVTVALHFGAEYQTTPNEEQKQLARALVAAGADIIAGSHPHVLQPYEVIETLDAKGNKKSALIIYSMGNFISNQRGGSKDYGVIFKVNIRKNVTEGTINLTEVEAIPTWVHRYKPDKSYRYRILPIEETLAEANDKLLRASDYETMKKDFEMLKTRLDSMK
ncbi:CapA family protein [Paenibacillus sp. GSMTC-2017]|uniref:CapA family protein n=1 Tax=Paenibacillus sp. GSMTC-2017 TaxID=2794350 RepID=UPI001E290F68|nr:CapA family protein [Paenibacillus sp. GSMTC-2017]